MKQDFQASGFFHRPGHSNTVFHGTFYYSIESGLSLVTHTKTDEPPKHHPLEDIPILFGVTSDSDCITLINCQDSGGHSNLHGIRERKFRISEAYIGTHHLPSDNMKFRAISAELHLGLEWHHNSGFDIQNSDYHANVDILYRAPPPINIAVNDDFNLTIHRTLEKFPSEFGYTQHVELKEHVAFEIRPRLPQSIQYFIDQIYMLCDFLTIAFDKPSFILDATAETDFTVDYQNAESVPVSLKTLFRQPDFNHCDNNGYCDDFIFCYSDTKDQLSEIINNWFSQKEKLRPAKNLFIAALHSPFSYIETEITCLSQAAESFHREFIATKHRYTFKERFSGLIHDNSSVIKHFIPTIENTIDTIVDFRNQLTHHNKKLDAGNHIPELAIYKEILKFVVHSSFLNLLGISADDSKNYFNRSRYYRVRLKHIDEYIKLNLSPEH